MILPYPDTKQTILIVDDEPINIRALQSTLGGEYNLLFATSGEMVLDMVKSGVQPDLILLDIIMPGMDGFEVCRRFKNDPKTQHIPLVFLTAKWETSEEARGLEKIGRAHV